jgi:hypothetical protein
MICNDHLSRASYRAGNGVGPRRVDDRRVNSGIIDGLQSGMRWPDCPKEYGPSTTIYNRWHRCRSSASPYRFPSQRLEHGLKNAHHDPAIIASLDLMAIPKPASHAIVRLSAPSKAER